MTPWQRTPGQLLGRCQTILAEIHADPRGILDSIYTRLLAFVMYVLWVYLFLTWSIGNKKSLWERSADCIGANEFRSVLNYSWIIALVMKIVIGAIYHLISHWRLLGLERSENYIADYKITCSYIRLGFCRGLEHLPHNSAKSNYDTLKRIRGNKLVRVMKPTTYPL